MAKSPEHERESFSALASRVVLSAKLAEEADPILSLFALDLRLEGVPRLLFLQDAVVESAVAPAAERPSIVAEWSRSVLDRPRDEGWATARRHILPVLRNAWFGSDALVRRASFDRHLAAFLSLGAGAYVNHADLKAWGINAETAFAAAIRNLQRLPVEEEVVEGGQRRVRAGEAEPGALLLVPGWLRGRKGAPLAAIPSRDLLLLSDRLEPADVNSYFHRGLQWSGWDRARQPISPLAYAPSTEGDLSAALPVSADAELALRAETYAAQSRALVEADREVDAPVAEYLRSDRQLICSWSEGREALLPEVNIVVLRRTDGRGSRDCPWDSLENIVGEAFVNLEAGLFPPRWRVPAWTAASLDRADLEVEDDEEEISGEEELPPEDEESNPGIREFAAVDGDLDPEEQEDDEEGEEEEEAGLLEGERDEEEGMEVARKDRAIPGMEGEGSHASRFLQALIQEGLLEVSGQHSLPSIEEAIAEVVEEDESGDWAALAAVLSLKLVEMPAVSELFADDAAMAALLARTAEQQ